LRGDNVRGNKVLGGLVLLAIIALLNLPLPAELKLRAATRDSTVLPQTVLAIMGQRCHELFTFLFSARQAVRERESMMDEVARLRHDLRYLKELNRENRQLRRMVDFKEASAHGLLLGRVISRGGVSGWWQSVRINRGSADGVKPQQAVITVDGLAGKTTTVTAHTCDVLLITDPSNRIACRLERTDALGVARGRGVGLGGKTEFEMVRAAEPFQVDYIDKHAEVVEGDTVLTSGLGGGYPEGLLLGHVVGTSLDRSRLYQSLSVRPAADLGRLRYVWVVVK